jgi:AAHS family 3-hydroxyphenylpropionic acid transporter
LLLWTAFVFVVLALHLLLNWLPLLMAGRGLTGAQASAAQMGFNLGGATCALIIGRLLDTRWQRVSMAVCLVALPLVLLLLAVSPPAYGLQIFLASLLGGALLAQQLVTYGVASSCYPEAARGVGVGAAVAAGRLGSLTGPMFAAMLLVAGGGPVQVLIGLLPIALLCSACVGALRWRRLRASPQGA